MFSNSEVADVLEKAADLYESEKVEWCKNRWGEPSRGDDGQVWISACAATALGLAAGLGVHVAGVIDGIVLFGCSDDTITREVDAHISERLDCEWVVTMTKNFGYDTVLGFTPEAVRLYRQARAEVEKLTHEKYWSSTLPNFNDGPNGTKEVVIDLFKETAKDLRNA